MSLSCLLALATSFAALAGGAGAPAQTPDAVRDVPGLAPAVATLAPEIAGATSFDIRASVLGFGARRRVSVEARVDRSLSGRLDVRFNRPLKGRMGIRRVEFKVHIVEEASGRVVDTLSASVEQGCTGFRLPFRLPRPGNYRFLMRNEDLRAGYARVRILPDGLAAMNVLAPVAPGPAVASTTVAGN